MRNLLFGAALIALGWVAANVTTTSAQAPPANERESWEYNVQTYNISFEAQRLTFEGQKGWELVSAFHNPNGQPVAVFKRQVR